MVVAALASIQALLWGQGRIIRVPADTTSIQAATNMAQVENNFTWKREPHPYRSAPPLAITVDTPSFYKRKAEWKKILNNYWGPGLPYQQKLDVFNTFADFVQTKFSAFNGLGVKWDSLRAHYRSQITDSTGHGTFSGIMNALAYNLREAHTIVLDAAYFRIDLGAGRVIYPEWGTPVLAAYGVDANHLGAALSPLPDSSLLVIRTVANHPLGLVPGDVVLGYEGVRWKDLWKELLAAEMPSILLFGGSWSSQAHLSLTAAGLNWHLFDTIDVVKYSTGDTLHLSLDTLRSLHFSGTLYSNQSLPVPGVPEPDYNIPPLNTRPVTYGRVQGTNIGYVHVTAHTIPATRDEFVGAVDALWDTDGMIVDLRNNMGGETLYHLGQGLAKLMNFKTYTFDMYRRASASDLFILEKFLPPSGSAGGRDWYIDADLETVYDRPIAVMVGPVCVSMGDVTAYTLKLLPNTRFFGKPTRGCTAGHWNKELLRDLHGFDMDASDVIALDYHDPSRSIERAEFPVDEELWLTQEDVVRAEDTVVKRALAWIRNVAHARAVTVSRRFCGPGTDTVHLTTHMENPNNHAISVLAYLKADSSILDSVAFADDGKHGDGSSGDGLWGATCYVPPGEQFYDVTVHVADPADPSTYSMPYAARFTTAGPVEFDYLMPARLSSDLVRFDNAIVHNRGSAALIPDVTGTIRRLDRDTVIDRIYNSRIAFGDIPPDSAVTTAQFYSLTLKPPLPDTVFLEIGVEFASSGAVYWRDTLRFLLKPFTGIAEQQRGIPSEFKLAQNYPNPFNPSTTIRFELPKSSHVRLSVYDMLGREVSVLTNERRDAGVYDVKFDASFLSSGVYLYTLRAGGFIQSRKLILLR
jgi:hypothetical protein